MFQLVYGYDAIVSSSYPPLFFPLVSVKFVSNSSFFGFFPFSIKVLPAVFFSLDFVHPPGRESYKSVAWHSRLSKNWLWYISARFFPPTPSLPYSLNSYNYEFFSSPGTSHLKSFWPLAGFSFCPEAPPVCLLDIYNSSFLFKILLKCYFF